MVHAGASSGTGDIVATVDLQAGATATYTLSAVVGAAATGTVTNTATVAAPVGVVDPVVSDNASSDTDTLTPSVDLSITKTDGVASVVPGSSTTYTISVANSGPSSAVDAQIIDVLPPEITAATWGCTAAGGATCGTPSGAGDRDAAGHGAGGRFGDDHGRRRHRRGSHRVRRQHGNGGRAPGSRRHESGERHSDRQ